MKNISQLIFILALGSVALYMLLCEPNTDSELLWFGLLLMSKAAGALLAFVTHAFMQRWHRHNKYIRYIID